MKRVFVIALLASLASCAVAFAFPIDVTVGFRTADLNTPIPAAGIVIGEGTTIAAELYKLDFWDFVWDGRYLVDSTLTVPVSFGWNVTAGITWPIDVTTNPTTFAFNSLRMPLGVSFGSGYPANIFARALFQVGEGGGYEGFEAGFNIRLIGTFQYLFPEQPANVE